MLSRNREPFQKSWALFQISCPTGLRSPEPAQRPCGSGHRQSRPASWSGLKSEGLTRTIRSGPGATPDFSLGHLARTKRYASSLEAADTSDPVKTSAWPVLVLVVLGTLAGCTSPATPNGSTPPLETGPTTQSAIGAPTVHPHAENATDGFHLTGDGSSNAVQGPGDATFSFSATNTDARTAWPNQCFSPWFYIRVQDADGTTLWPPRPPWLCPALSPPALHTGETATVKMTWNGTVFSYAGGYHTYAAPPGNYYVVASFLAYRWNETVSIDVRLPIGVLTPRAAPAPNAQNVSGDILLMGTADRGTFMRGEQVTFHYAARNIGTNATVVIFCDHGDTFTVREANGTQHEIPRPFEGSVCTQEDFPPGASKNWTIMWDGTLFLGDGTYAPAPPGDYAVEDAFATPSRPSVTLHVRLTQAPGPVTEPYDCNVGHPEVAFDDPSLYADLGNNTPLGWNVTWAESENGLPLQNATMARLHASLQNVVGPNTGLSPSGQIGAIPSAALDLVGPGGDVELRADGSASAVRNAALPFLENVSALPRGDQAAWAENFSHERVVMEGYGPGALYGFGFQHLYGSWRLDALFARAVPWPIPPGKIVAGNVDGNQWTFIFHFAPRFVFRGNATFSVDYDGHGTFYWPRPRSTHLTPEQTLADYRAAYLSLGRGDPPPGQFGSGAVC